MPRHAVVDYFKVPRQNIVTDPSDLHKGRIIIESILLACITS